MIIDLDAERGRISLSTKQLEPEPGDMLKNREIVFEKAEEMAEKYRQKLLAEAEGITVEELAAADESEAIEEPVSETTEEVVETSEEPVSEVPVKEASESEEMVGASTEE